MFATIPPFAFKILLGAWCVLCSNGSTNREAKKSFPIHNKIQQNDVYFITDFNVIPNSPKDQTKQIQRAFQQASGLGKKLVINKGVYWISGVDNQDNKQYLFDRGGIKVYSNSNIEFQNGAIFRVIPNEFQAYNALRIWEAENVTITNATLIGDKNEHKGNKGEWGYGILIAGSKNITINKASIAEFWGDGINLNCSNTNQILRINETIRIENVHGLNNRRQGMSIEAGKNITVRNCTFENNRGTNPQSGIDIEPWGDQYETVQNVWIENCNFIDNPNGVMVNFPTLKNIQIKNCTFKASSKGRVERHFWQLYGDNEVEIEKCTFDEKATNILIHSGKSTKITDCSFNNDIWIDPKSPVNVFLTNATLDKAKITVTNSKLTGNVEVTKSKFLNNSKIEVRGKIRSKIDFNTFKNSDEIFISDESSQQTIIDNNHFNTSTFQAIGTVGNATITNNVSKNSEVFLVVKEGASDIKIENNTIATKINQAFAFRNPKSNRQIKIKNNKLSNKTEIIKNFQYDLLRNASNSLIQDNVQWIVKDNGKSKVSANQKKVRILQ